MQKYSPGKPFSFRDLFDKKKRIFEIVGFLAVTAGLALQINNDSKIIGYRNVQAVTLLLFLLSVWWFLIDFAHELNNEIEKRLEGDKTWRGEWLMLQILLTVPQQLFVPFIFFKFYINNFLYEFLKIFHLIFFPCLAIISIGISIISKSAWQNGRWLSAVFAIIYGAIVCLSLIHGFNVSVLLSVVVGLSLSIFMFVTSGLEIKVWLCALVSVFVVLLSVVLARYLTSSSLSNKGSKIVYDLSNFQHDSHASKACFKASQAP